MTSMGLDDGQIERVLAELNGWRREGDALVKTFKFTDFRAALAFMVQAGFAAEAANHHPEWTNVYNRVAVRLTTHDAGNTITTKDVVLAKAFDEIEKSKG